MRIQSHLEPECIRENMIAYLKSSQKFIWKGAFRFLKINEILNIIKICNIDALTYEVDEK